VGNLSILVVSKTAQLLSRLLSSIPDALQGYEGDFEVLCSWNGTAEEERQVISAQGVELYFSQRTPYHFARNCNQLAQQACGDLLLFINDDLILDPGSITAAVQTLQQQNQCGIVGAKLTNQSGTVGHAGILFDHNHKPFHRYLDSPINHPLTLRTERVPAATGAFLLTRGSDYSKCPMNEAYINNGEDVELCLAYKMKLGLNTFVCHRATGQHPERSTRDNQLADTGFGNDSSEDLARMRKVRQQFLQMLKRQDLEEELDLACRETSWLQQRISDLETVHQDDRNQQANLALEIAAKAELQAAERQQTDEALDQARRTAELELSEAHRVAEQARQRSIAWKQAFRSNGSF